MPQFWVWMHYCHPTSHWTVYSASLFLPENMKLLHILIQLMWIQSSQEWNPERQHIISKSYRRRQSSGNCEAEHLTLNTLKITDRQSPQREHLKQSVSLFVVHDPWSRTSECCVTHLYLPTSVQLPSWPAAVIILLWSYDYITSVVAGWD